VTTTATATNSATPVMKERPAITINVRANLTIRFPVSGHSVVEGEVGK